MTDTTPNSQPDDERAATRRRRYGFFSLELVPSVLCFPLAVLGAVGVWFYASLLPTAGAAVGTTMLVATAEFIKLALDIQTNTLVTARATAGRSS